MLYSARRNRRLGYLRRQEEFGPKSVVVALCVSNAYLWEAP